MKQQIKDYFSFNKRERNGILILLFIFILIVSIPYILPFIVKNEPVDFSLFQKDIAAFEKSLQKLPTERKDSFKTKEFDYSNIDKSSAEIKLNPFNFDPNNMSEEKWKEIGLSDRQIKTIKNYIEKGGKFYKKEDFKKMYCISESEYSILEPYIQIPDKKKSFKKKEKPIYKSEKNIRIIELNSSDTSDFKTLKGIGSYFAKKIIAYRTKLGGFYEKEQLFDIKGMDSTRYSGIEDYISINKFLINTININTASYDDFKNHPYIGYNIALSLVNMRKVHGKYNNVSEIKQSALVTEKIYEKIAPYLSID